MLSKLPGVFSEKTGVRIFSRIYYSLLFLLLAMLVSINREDMCMQDKIVNILDKFLFFMVFAAPVPIIHFMKKKGSKFPEIFFVIVVAVFVFLMSSMYTEKFYTDEYKAQMYTQSKLMNKAE